MPPTRQNGILLLDKPGLDTIGSAPGDGDARLPTSHDMVQRVRKCFGLRRVGHAGTLDPFASGLLVLCLGRATRLVEYYQGLRKVYVAQVRFGTETTTDDITGEPLDEARAALPDARDARAALLSYVGEQEQMPPRFSARKVQGQRAHVLARAGIEVQLAPRTIHIYRIEAQEWCGSGDLVFTVECSAGTYIRSLARDLGRDLGVGACLAGLRRIAIGALHVDQAVAPQALEQVVQGDAGQKAWLAPGTGLPGPRVVCDPALSRHLGQGQAVWLEAPAADVAPGTTVLAADEQGAFLGILTCISTVHSARIRLKARKWLGPIE